MNNFTERTPAIQHPLAGSSFINLLNLLFKNQPTEPLYVQKAFKIALLSLSNLPLCIIERLVFGKRIDKTEIVKPPIFIIGHWRSGTTYLHRVMVQDDNFGYVSSSQAYLPQSFLVASKWGKNKLHKIWPQTRDMDNMNYSPDVPEEEEHALTSILSLAFYHCMYFPQNMQQIFKQSVLMKSISQKDLAVWQKVYMQIIKKATFASGNKQLILKNPANTGRIKQILEIFPNAKFVYIYRNPYDVFASMQNFYNKVLPKCSLQKIDRQKVTENIFNFYRQLIQKYYIDKDNIPAKNLIEIKYEDLEKNELSNIEKIYNKFNLSNFEVASDNMRKYINLQANYKKNNYVLNEQIKREIAHRWDFAIERWQSS